MGSIILSFGSFYLWHIILPSKLACLFKYYCVHCHFVLIFLSLFLLHPLFFHLFSLLSSRVVIRDPTSDYGTATKTRFWGFASCIVSHVFILQLLLPAPSVWLQVMTEFAALTHDGAVMSLAPPPLSPSHLVTVSSLSRLCLCHLCGLVFHLHCLDLRSL